MTGVPDKFFRREISHVFPHKLPTPGHYAVGNLFFSPVEADRLEHIETFTKLADGLGLRVLGWREVPTDGSILGPSSKSKEPKILQPFVVLREHYGEGEESKEGRFDEKRFERQLYVLRKHSTHTMKKTTKWFYICSLSSKNIVYKVCLSTFLWNRLSTDFLCEFRLL
jgi:glutamate synthase (NADPH/NADH)